jgi:hypothetical protein
MPGAIDSRCCDALVQVVCEGPDIWEVCTACGNPCEIGPSNQTLISILYEAYQRTTEEG